MIGMIGIIGKNFPPWCPGAAEPDVTAASSALGGGNTGAAGSGRVGKVSATAGTSIGVSNTFSAGSWARVGNMGFAE